MNSVKILHAADLHMDSPFEALPGEKAAIRRAEQRRLLGRLAQLANREGVQLVLLAGDLLDTGDAYMETAEELIKALGSIDARVFISPGNHDYFSAKSPYNKLKWPKNVHIFNNSCVERIELPDIGAAVYGAGFTDTTCPGLLKDFHAGRNGDMVNIMCIHGEVNAPVGAYNPITTQEISRSGLDYLALGHVHAESGLQRAGDTFYAWPGCPEGRGFDETGDKFVYIAQVSEEGCKLRRECVAKRKYEILNVDMSGGEDIISQIPDNTENDIYRIILTGDTEDAPDMAAIKNRLENRFFALQLRDRTSLRRPLWDRAGEDSLRGVFLKKLKTMHDSAATEEQRQLYKSAALWGLAALDNREEPAGHEDK